MERIGNTRRIQNIQLSLERDPPRHQLKRVIDKIRNIPQIQKGEQPGTSDGTQEAVSPPETIETESTSSVESFGVPANNFKNYLGTTGVRNIQSGQSHPKRK